MIGCGFTKPDHRVDEMMIDKWQPELDRVGHAQTVTLSDPVLAEIGRHDQLIGGVGGKSGGVSPRMASP